MDVVFLGLNDVGERVYEWLCDRHGVDVRALLTRNEQLDVVEEFQPDVLVSVGYNHRVPTDILEIPADGAINLHPSYLPYNRGKSPNVWCIIDGTPTGATLHYMAEEFDTGDIIARTTVETSFADTGKSVHDRLEDEQFRLFTETWPQIEAGSVSATPQPKNEGSYHSVSDFNELCEIEPSEAVEAKSFLNRLRALTFPPFNNAYIDVDGERYYIDIDVISESEAAEEPSTGRITAYD